MKKIFLIASVCVLAAVSSYGGYALAQAPAKKPLVTTPTDWEALAQLTATVGGEEGAKTLATLYEQTAGNATLTHAAAKVAFEWDERAKPLDTSLMVLQVMQNQKIIEQNAQIIKLLGQQSKAK